MSTEEGVYYAQDDYAGLFRRLVAETVDFLMAVALTVGVDWLVIRISFDTLEPTLAFILSAVIVGVVYLILVKRYFRTLGYVIAGMEVVDPRGNRPGINALALRFLFLFLGPLLPILDILWIPRDAQRRALRDKLAHTCVVKKGSPRPLLPLSCLLLFPFASAATAQQQTRPPEKVIHVLVALCDNKFQGIVPVPEKIGNGDDPANNLYWGAAYGVKTFFLKSPDWTFVIKSAHPKPGVLERYVFQHKSKPVHLIADAYRGRDIRKSTYDFLQFAAGRDAETVPVPSGKLQGGGAADLIAYVGHDGLMDFSLPAPARGATDRSRSTILLACASKPYFQNYLRPTGAHPLLWTTNLMAPEAYVLKAALDGWVLGEDGEKIRRRAATAYNKYQKCGMKAALNLFATGW